MNPKDNIIALKAGPKIQIFNLSTKQKIKVSIAAEVLGLMQSRTIKCKKILSSGDGLTLIRSGWLQSEAFITGLLCNKMPHHKRCLIDRITSMDVKLSTTEQMCKSRGYYLSEFLHVIVVLLALCSCILSKRRYSLHSVLLLIRSC